jgi:hypothetical protein
MRKSCQTAADDNMDVDQDKALQADESSKDKDDELDSNKVKALKVDQLAQCTFLCFSPIIYFGRLAEGT